jgi:hypothetical protein
VKQRLCLAHDCQNDISHKLPNAKYCSNACLKRHKRQQKTGARLAQRKGVLPEAYKQARDVIMEKVDDEVRDVLREEVRASISDQVKQNVLGASEAITALLPQAIAVFAEDLQSKDWMKRNKAALAVAKLAFPLANEDANRKDSGQVVIVHSVPLPDTTLGRRVAEHLENAEEIVEGGVVNPDLPYDAEHNPEKFEVNYPICKGCRERKHPDMIKHDGKCSTCHYREEIMTGHVQDLSADVDRTLW